MGGLVPIAHDRDDRKRLGRVLIISPRIAAAAAGCGASEDTFEDGRKANTERAGHGETDAGTRALSTRSGASGGERAGGDVPARRHIPWLLALPGVRVVTAVPLAVLAVRRLRGLAVTTSFGPERGRGLLPPANGKDTGRTP